MTKQRNTVLLIVAGVLFNLLCMSLVFFTLIWLFAILFAGRVPELAGQFLLVLALLTAAGSSFLLYKSLFKRFRQDKKEDQ
ncbi:MAG: hypothetical protein D6B26_06630 [Spirochaetaceae bacterium]|nr:MAG: hypothetical protein D6B26_06630 [Spirochaetaceae bacterium]